MVIEISLFDDEERICRRESVLLTLEQIYIYILSFKIIISCALDINETISPEYYTSNVGRVIFHRMVAI